MPLICFVGATATGKTSLAIRLALAFAKVGIHAEIVNADSMLVYRGMDIGTAKPSVQERSGIDHHLIDIMEVTHTASVAVFQAQARDAISMVRARGGLPILVGGSALYLHAIVDRFDFPPTDDEVRSRLNQELGVLGAHTMYERLYEASPEVAEKVGVSDSRRIVRALEALEVHGTFSPDLPRWEYALDDVTQIGLRIDRTLMDERIGRRVERMWQGGLVDETEDLLRRGLREGKTASRAIGYRQAIDHIDGLVGREEAMESTTIRTRQFSRKQLGWWRRDPRIVWVDAPGFPLDAVVSIVASGDVLSQKLSTLDGGQSHI